jgi:hypothetical protein
MLTRRLSAAASIPVLITLTTRHTGLLTPVQVAAAISRAAKLSSSTSRPPQQQQHWQQHRQQQQQQVLPWLEQLLGQFAGQMRAAGPAELSCVVGGMARLGISGTKNNVILDVTLACLDASLPLLGDQQQFDNKLLLQLAWGAARLSVMPPVEWLQAFEGASIQRCACVWGVLGACEDGCTCHCAKANPHDLLPALACIALPALSCPALMLAGCTPSTTKTQQILHPN